MVLGYKAYHQTNVFSDPIKLKSWDNIVKQKNIMKQKYGDDWYKHDDTLINLTKDDIKRIYLDYGYNVGICVPTLIIFKEIIKLYPNIKVILTKRDENKWYTSIIKTLYPIQSLSNKWLLKWFTNFKLVTTFLDNVCWGLIFDHKVGKDKEYSINKYNEWNNLVINSVKKDNLLIYEPGDGWEPLCKFLNKDVPWYMDYPRTNSKANVKKIKSTIIMVCNAVNFILFVIGISILYYLFMKFTNYY